MDIQEKYLEKLKNGLGQLEISYTEEMIAAFFHYYEMMIEKNKVMNLTAITELDEVIEKHFLDSVSLARSMELHKKMRVLDIGTGAGFPGIPLKILFPELDILLMDSLNKRVRFLDEVIHQLGLDGIAAVHGRAEDMAQKSEYREQFHLCVSRAVANMASLCEYCIPFLKVGGTFVSYKSGDVENEVTQAKKAISVLGGKIVNIEKFIITGTRLSRSFVIIEKVKHTPRPYPRKAGIPSRDPL